MKSNIIPLIVILTAALTIHAKTFDYCEIRGILEKHKWMKERILDWMCLIENESNYRSNVTGKLNVEPNGEWPEGHQGSWDYGIFQVSEKFFCRGKHYGNFHFKKNQIQKSWYFVTKIVLTYCEKNCSSDRETRG